ncbi:MAG: hypothetical protein HRT70_04035 [Flavobacteriaceae bacterium]|nr:hypothetical protein [Flavobacteriaceae bacterium]
MTFFQNINIPKHINLKQGLKYVVLLSSLYLFPFTIFAQKVRVKADTTNIRIGEQFEYQITVGDTANVIIPKLESITGLEIVEDLPLDTVKNNLFKKYILTGFDSGAFYIPSQQIFIRNRAYITDSILINVATVAVDTLQQKMFPIKSIQSEPWVFNDFKPYLIWVVLGILLIAALIIYLRTRKKKESLEKAVIPTIPAFEEAIAKLKELDEKLLWQNNRIKEYYTELTEILQNYLGKDVEIPTQELTSSEIIELVKTQNKTRHLEIEQHTFKNLHLVLKNADLVKFAKSKPLSHEIEVDRKLTENIISNIQPKIKAYKAIIAKEQEILTKQEETVTPQKTSLETVSPSVLRKVDRKKTVRIIIAIATVILAVNFVPKMINHLIPLSSEGLLKKAWVTKTYGVAPSITISTPVELTKQPDLDIPDNIKNLIISSGNYSYSNKRASLEIALTTNSFDSSVQTSLDNAVSGAQRELSQDLEVTDLTSQIEVIDIDGVSGKKVTGTLKKKGTPLVYTSIFLLDKNKLGVIILTSLKDDIAAQNIVEKIVNSIKIDSAYVE